VAEVQRRQKDVGQALDERLRKLEPEGDAGRPRNRGRPGRKARLRRRHGRHPRGDFERSAGLLAPSSGAFRAARIWIRCASGWAMRCTASATTRKPSPFRAFVAAAPDHARAPEALLALANSQAEMKDPRGARKTIDELIKAYPKSEAAQAGKERLASIK
jgi:hypothetical protein